MIVRCGYCGSDAHTTAECPQAFEYEDTDPDAADDDVDDDDWADE